MRESSLATLTVVSIAALATCSFGKTNDNDFPTSSNQTEAAEGIECNINSTDPKISWCKYNNPFILSDFLSRNSTTLTQKEDGSGEKFELSIQCSADTQEPTNSTCRAISQIRSGSFGIPDNGNGNMSRFVMFTDLDGKMLFVNFNNNTMATSVEVDVENVRFFDTMQTHYPMTVSAAGDDPVGNDANITTVQDISMLVANATALALVEIDGVDRSISTCYIFSNRTYFKEFPEQSLAKAEFYPKSPNASDITNLLWVWAVDDLSAWMKAAGHKVEPWMKLVSQYDITTVPIVQSDIRRYIETCPQSTPMGVELQVRLYSPSPAKFEVFHNKESNMTFLFAYTKRAVAMYRLSYEGHTQNFSSQGVSYDFVEEAGVLYEWCENHTMFNATSQTWYEATRPRTTIFCIPETDQETEITALGVFAPDQFKNIGYFKRVIWLAVALKNSTTAFAHVFDLEELMWVNNTDSTLLNPLGLPSNFGFPSYPCNFETSYYSPFLDRCMDRYLIKFAFDTPDPVTLLEAIAISAISNEDLTPHLNNFTGGGNNGTNQNGTNPFNNSTNWRKAFNYPEYYGWEPNAKVPLQTNDHILLFAARNRTVEVFSMYETDIFSAKLNKPIVGLDYVNQIHFLGDVQYLHVSNNGQHLFAAVSRKKWELESQERYLDICNALSQDPTDPFLSPFQSSCDQLPAQEINLNSFTQYASLCSTTIYCPYLNTLAAELPGPGLYAERPAVLKPCPKGSFCITGQKQQCPPGFYCPTEGLSSPIRCPQAVNYNLTCSNWGQVEPEPCRDGTVCMVNHIPGLPAPPGYMIPAPPATRDDLLPCPEGWWCNLGIQQPYNDTVTGMMTPYDFDTLYCPGNTFCYNSSILQPEVCKCDDADQIDYHGNMIDCDDRTMYCPPMTTNISWCPAGSYCTKPNVSVACVETQYCPEGTFAPQLCPAGFYCPNASVKVICPSSNYCQRGSTVPSPCNILTVCPQGSESQSRSFLSLVLLIGVIGGVLLGFWGFNYTMKKREEKIAAAMEASAEARYFMQTGGEDEDDKETLMTSVEGGRALADIPISRFTTPNITFDGMGLTLNVGEHKGKKVLDDVTGEIPPGSFVAVMGPSGSGKSTFMHTLAGKAFYGERHGRVLVNGEEVNLTEFSKVMGFVKQDDIMLREMTVEETLLFNAKMRFDPHSGETPASIAKAMTRVLDLNHVKDINIGDEKKRGISGGQRKRVNIGMEMCALPCILFLDEPTSGLDSSSSMTVCQALRDMADAGVTVIAVIHQPRYEIFKMFHKVMLLAKGGKLVYYGDPEEAMPYFEEDLGIDCPPHVNPPDFFMDTISGDVLASAAKGSKAGGGAASPTGKGAMGERQGSGSFLTVDELVKKWNESEKNHLPPLIRKERGMKTETEPNVVDSSILKPGTTSINQTESKIDGSDEPNHSNTSSATNRRGENGAAEAEVHEQPPLTAAALEPYGEPSVMPDYLDKKKMEPGTQLAAAARQKQMAGFFTQLSLFTNRCIVQMSRDLIWFFTDLVLVLVAGFFMGLVFSNSQYLPPLPGQIINQSLSGFGNSPPKNLVEFFDRPINDPIISEASLTCMAIGMTGITAALRVFGNEQVVYWREASAGMSTTAYFLAKNLTHLFFILLSPLLYLAPFLTFVSARAPFYEWYQICIIVQFTTTGLGYLVSVTVPQGLAQLGGVVAVLVLSMFGGARPTLPQINAMLAPLHAMPYISYIRWAQEALYLQEITQWQKVQGVNIQPSLDLFDYKLEDYWTCVWVTLGYGFFFRICALAAMFLLNRHQKH